MSANWAIMPMTRATVFHSKILIKMAAGDSLTWEGFQPIFQRWLPFCVHNLCIGRKKGEKFISLADTCSRAIYLESCGMRRLGDGSRPPSSGSLMGYVPWRLKRWSSTTMIFTSHRWWFWKILFIRRHVEQRSKMPHYIFYDGWLWRGRNNCTEAVFRKVWCNKSTLCRGRIEVTNLTKRFDEKIEQREKKCIVCGGLDACYIGPCQFITVYCVI